MKRSSRLETAVLMAFFGISIGMAAQAPAPPPPPPPLPASTTGNLAIPAGQKMIMQLETPLHTRTTHKGDKVEFTTAADVLVNGQVAIPDKSSVRAVVTECKRAGRMFGRAQIQLKFQEIRLADGSLLPMRASITRVGFDQVDPNKDGDPQIKGEHGAGGDVGTLVKGGAQGAIIGVLYGGAKGAAYGSATGAAVAAVGMMLKRGPDLDLPRTTMFEAQFDQPLEISAAAAQQAAQVTSSRPADKPLLSTTIHPAPAPPPPEPPEQPRPVLKRREPPPAGEPAAPAPEAAPPAAETKSRPPSPAEENPVEAPAGVTLSIKVRMVQVDAVIQDRAGHMLENLTKDDFRVYEDGVLQEIQSFSRDELPLAVALVIDRSGSVAPYIAELRRIATRALDQLKADDEVCLFSFAADVQRIEELTPDRRRIADGIARVHAGGGTDIVDALHDSVNYLARVAPDRRHAVILISDNQQTVQPQASEGETIRTAMETEAVVYSIKTAGEGPLFTNRLPSLFGGSGPVGKITQETGGEIINAGSVASLDAALASVISRLRMRYSMGYYPSSAGQGGAFHAISVKLTEAHGKPGNDYFMRARRGYYSTSDRLR